MGEKGEREGEGRKVEAGEEHVCVCVCVSKPCV